MSRDTPYLEIDFLEQRIKELEEDLAQRDRIIESNIKRIDQLHQGSKPDYICQDDNCESHRLFREIAAEYQKHLIAAYKCIIDGTKAFAPPADGKDVRKWFDDHQEVIDDVLEWKKGLSE